MWTKLNGLVLVLLWMTSFVGLALAQDDIVTKRVQFMCGSSSPTDGAYTIRVYLVRAEARRGGKADFECTVSIIK